MTSDPPEYFVAAEVIREAKVGRSQFYRHLAADVGQIRTKAREVIKGLGVRYKAKFCQKYFALVRRPSKPANT